MIDGQTGAEVNDQNGSYLLVCGVVFTVVSAGGVVLCVG